jgi:hypothetical protein
MKSSTEPEHSILACIAGGLKDWQISLRLSVPLDVVQSIRRKLYAPLNSRGNRR